MFQFPITHNINLWKLHGPQSNHLWFDNSGFEAPIHSLVLQSCGGILCCVCFLLRTGCTCTPWYRKWLNENGRHIMQIMVLTLWSLVEWWMCGFVGLCTLVWWCPPDMCLFGHAGSLAVLSHAFGWMLLRLMMRSMSPGIKMAATDAAQEWRAVSVGMCCSFYYLSLLSIATSKQLQYLQQHT